MRLVYLDSDIVKKLKAAQHYTANCPNFPSMDNLEIEKSFSVDIKDLESNLALKSSWPTLLEEIKTDAEKVVGIFGLAKHQAILDQLEEELKSSGDPGDREEAKFPIIRARFINLEPVLDNLELKSKNYGKVLTVCGTVVRVSGIRPTCIWLAFTCNQCNALQSVYQPYGEYTEPVRCVGPACRCRKFEPQRSNRKTITVDWQSIKLQENAHYGGGVPKTVEAELTETLCDKAMPGDTVTITGIVRTLDAEGDRGSFGKQGTKFQLYIHALNLVNAKRSQSGNNAARNNMSEYLPKSNMEFSISDYGDIQDIEALGSDIFKLLTHSLCPSIYGHELVKAGLVLGLFGGKEHNYVN